MKGKFIYLFWLALLIPSLAYSNIFDQSNPARWVCGSDLNGNGYLGEEGETAACIGNAPSNYCPIGAAVCTQKSESKTTSPTYTCSSGSLVGSQCKINTSECRSEGSNYVVRIVIRNSSNCYVSGEGYRWNSRHVAPGEYFQGAFVHRYSIGTCKGSQVWEDYQICRNVTSYIPATPICPSGFVFNSSSNLCVQNTLVDVCPLGSQYQCVPNGGAKYCSPNKCVDKKDPANEEAKDVDGNMLVDDGKRNDQGLCLDQVYIYNGRGQRCLKSGIETAFQNCCKDKGKVFQDGAGAYSSIGTASQTISGLYSVAEMAYVTYSAQTAAGVSSAFAAELAASAAQQQLLIAFDPTTIAISVAMHFVMEWVMNACDQMDMETAMAHSSGYCVEVGEYCKKKIKFIGCVQKARSFCCFNSKLARIIQEQGRPQLTTVNGFGTPSEPNCRGFTPEEFQRIDFAKIDLGEYIEELQKHTQEQVQQNIQQVTEDFFNKVK